MKLFFASINLPMVTNIFSVSLLMALEKRIPSRVKLTGFFIFFEHILDRVIFNLYFCGVYFCIVFNVFLASYADKINSCLNFCLLFIFPIWVSWKLCTLWSIVSIFFQLNFAISLHKKFTFPLRISSVNMTKSGGNCRFGYIYWRNP